MEPGRVPATGIRVRCPRCAHVFSLRPAAGAPAPASPAAPRVPASTGGAEFAGFERDLRQPPRPRTAPLSARQPAPPAPGGSRPLPGGWHPEPERTLDFETPAPKSAPQRLETPPFNPLPAVESVPAATTTAAPAPAPSGEERLDPAHARAHRLARVLVSDLLVYNQAACERARGEGKLAAALGAEIGKAWELYKSKVGPEVATSTTYFKDALNEILAEGEKIF